MTTLKTAAELSAHIDAVQVEDAIAAAAVPATTATTSDLIKSALTIENTQTWVTDAPDALRAVILKDMHATVAGLPIDMLNDHSKYFEVSGPLTTMVRDALKAGNMYSKVNQNAVSAIATGLIPMIKERARLTALQVKIDTGTPAQAKKAATTLAKAKPLSNDLKKLSASGAKSVAKALDTKTPLKGYRKPKAETVAAVATDAEAAEPATGPEAPEAAPDTAVMDAHRQTILSTFDMGRASLSDDTLGKADLRAVIAAFVALYDVVGVYVPDDIITL